MPEMEDKEVLKGECIAKMEQKVKGKVARLEQHGRNEIQGYWDC